MKRSVKVRFYLSKDKELSSDDKGIDNRTRVLQSLGGFESTCIDRFGNNCEVLGVSIEGRDIGDSLEYGDYYLITVIDEEKELTSEINRDNNKMIFKVRYTGQRPGISIKPIDLWFNKVYDMHGNSIKSDVKNDHLLDHLPSGQLLIIDRGGKRTKIYKN